MAQPQDGARSTLEQLLAQQDQIAKQIKALREQERAEGLEQIKTIMVRLGLTPKDLAGAIGSGRQSQAKGEPQATGEDEGSSVKRGKTTAVAQKFRDPESGLGWSGRGLQPRWLKQKLEAGASLEDFRIK